MKIRSAITAVATCCLLLFNSGSAVGAEKLPTFRDIKGSFAEPSIIRLTQQGMIHGVSSEEFAPNKNVTRLQFAILVAKTLGVQPYFPPKPSFTDITPGSLEAGYIEALVKLGVLKGTGANNFSGNRLVLRQDAAVILQKALAKIEGTSKPSGTYTDANKISPYALNSVNYVTTQGWMKGSNGSFYPLKNVTRAEAAVLADRLLKERKEQAARALEQPVDYREFKTGSSVRMESQLTDYPIPFTPTYGLDNAAIGSVGSDGILLTGQNPGTAKLTVNAGSNSYPITINSDSSFENSSENGLDKGQSTVNSAVYGNSGNILKAPYKISQHSPDLGFKNTEYRNYSGPVDGLMSKSDAWTGFLRQQGRDIVIDLSYIKTVSSISMEFKQDAASGVYLPRYMQAYVSADGVSWYQLGHVYHGIEPSDSKVQNATLTMSFPAVATRYVKITFPVDVWVFARHLTIKGQLPSNPVVLAPDVRESGSAGAYLKDPDIKDILLIYTGNRSEAQTLTADDFMSLAAYMSPQKEIKGRMFDTMLFLPVNGHPCTKEGWSSYLEDLFAPGKQLYALEEAIDRINTSTGVQIKENVILTLPYPDSNQMDFGPIGQDGSTFSFSEKNTDRVEAANNRFEAVQWYYNQLMNNWNAAGFKNLNLAGIYWYGETVNQAVYGEAELIQKVSQVVRGNCQKFFWIPAYGAQGFENWKSYGFTHVLLQPNYYATAETPEERMDRATELAKKYGTGIEIELDNRILTSRYYYDLFYKEMKKAHELGLDRDTPNAYYIGTKKTLLDTVYSEISEIRGIYDDMYKWINGVFS